MLGMSFSDIDLDCSNDIQVNLSSVCAVFAQSEIVKLLASNTEVMDIIIAVVKQILLKAKELLHKVDCTQLFLSGGLSQIERIDELAEKLLGVRCIRMEKGPYVSAIGCTII